MDMTKEEIEAFLNAAKVGRLAMADSNQPYVIPLLFAYRDGRLFFHLHRSGRKLEFLERNPRACFEVDELNDDESWRSVIAFGEITLRESEDAMRQAMEALAGHYGKSYSYYEFAAPGMCAAEFRIESMTGRRS
jgi:nitroimidazol reductase NimA-like FMN-containing flavoprotein (pyridoxamine 5'-phosphate oxidase superfamily)